jgi:hypothetical protein
MSAALRQRWGEGKRTSRRGRLLASLAGTVPWSELEPLGVRGPRGRARHAPPHPVPQAEGPDASSLARGGAGGATVAPRAAACERQLRALPRRARRALQRHFALPLAELALILALWQGPAWAATINVDGVTCTLAQAITAANTDAMVGGCLAGSSGADTLVLPAGGIITLTSVDNSTFGATGLPVVASTITIAGQGGTIERGVGSPNFRLLAVDGLAGNLTVRDLTLRGGVADGGSGGGVYNQGSLTLTNSTLSANAATSDGGGLFNSGTLTLTNSTLSGNVAGSNGGGVLNNGTLTMTNSTLSSNTSAYGGGVYNRSALTLANSTLSGNSAGSGGTGGGGGVVNTGSLTLTNTSLSGNLAGNNGGGVSNTGSLTLTNTLISGNLAPTVAEVNNILSGVVTADEFNLFGHDSNAGVFGFAPGSTDIIPSQSVSAILDSALAFNGGPTQTHALVGGSPALDAVTAGSCPPADQRGFVRPSGANCDVGAVESGASLPPVVSSPLDFVPLPETFSTTTDTTGCPGGVAGKFFFQAQLTNQDGGVFLLALKQSVLSLSNGNLLQTADGGAGGVGGQQTLPQVGDFSDGTLEPAGAVVVPMAICLQTIDPFQFTVDVLGVQLLP